MTARKPRAGDVDVQIGRRIKQARIAIEWTQERLAEEVDLTFQQIQKYERGVNRVSAAKLMEIAGVIGVPIGQLTGEEQPTVAVHPDTREATRLFDRMPRHVQRAMLQMLRSVSTDRRVA